jgi:hypothetical protein
MSDRVVPVPVEKAEIRTRLATGSRLTTRIRVGDDYRASLMIASRLADMFRQPTPVRTVDPKQNAAELRDLHPAAHLAAHVRRNGHEDRVESLHVPHQARPRTPHAALDIVGFLAPFRRLGACIALGSKLGIPHHVIVLEVVESPLLLANESLIENLNQVRAAGVRVLQGGPSARQRV